MLLIARCYINRLYCKIVFKGVVLMIQKSLGMRVQKLRRETGLSQEKFALQINMDRTYLASVEAGKRNISIQNLKKIADGLDMPLSELFYGL